MDDLVLSEDNACGVFAGGAARCWGQWNGALFSLSISAGQLDDVVELGVGESAFESEDQLLTDFFCARLSGGAVQCCGNGYQGQLGLDVGVGGASMSPKPIEGLPPGVTGLAVGERHACAMNRAGGTYCWGSNKHGQIGIGPAAGDKIVRPTTVSLPDKVVQLVASRMDTCALLDGGDVYCWGRNWSGQSGASPSGIAWSPRRVEIAQRSRRLSAGRFTLCAVLSDGHITCWGDFGTQLGPEFGDGITATVPGIDDATAVAVGYTHACAIRRDATLWCWGTGDNGELGDGRRVSSWTPVLVPLPSPVIRVVAGNLETCARLADRRWFCWGANRNGAIAPRDTGPITSPRLLDLSEL